MPSTGAGLSIDEASPVMLVLGLGLCLGTEIIQIKYLHALDGFLLWYLHLCMLLVLGRS